MSTSTGLKSTKSIIATRGLLIFAFLEACMVGGYIVICSLGLANLIEEQVFPSFIWELPHVFSVLIAIVIGQFYFASLLWPAIVIYGVAIALDISVLIRRSISMSQVYDGTLPSYYLKYAWLSLWCPWFIVLFLILLSAGQWSRLWGIRSHEINYMSSSDYNRNYAFNRGRANRHFTTIQMVGIFDACWTIFYFVVAFRYLSAYNTEGKIWLQSIHFVAWVFAAVASATRNPKALVINAVVAVLAGIFDGVSIISYIGSLVGCIEETLPLSCTNTQLEELLLILFTFVYIVVDFIQLFQNFMLFKVYRNFIVNKRE